MPDLLLQDMSRRVHRTMAWMPILLTGPQPTGLHHNLLQEDVRHHMAHGRNHLAVRTRLWKSCLRCPQCQIRRNMHKRTTNAQLQAVTLMCQEWSGGSE